VTWYLHNLEWPVQESQPQPIGTVEDPVKQSAMVTDPLWQLFVCGLQVNLSASPGAQHQLLVACDTLPLQMIIGNYGPGDLAHFGKVRVSREFRRRARH